MSVQLSLNTKFSFIQTQSNSLRLSLDTVFVRLMRLSIYHPTFP